MSTPKQVGEVRSVGTVIVLMMLTFGIYGLYWNYLSFGEVRRYRGTGVGGGAGVLLAMIGVAPFLLPSYIGQMYKDANEDPPVSGSTGLWMFPGAFILIGPIVFLSKVQGALNLFWQLASEPAAAEAPTPAPAS